MTSKSLNITTLASGILSVVGTGHQIYQAAANAMDSVEIQGVLTGAKKKEAVMQFIMGLVLEIGENWDSKYKQLISTFIDRKHPLNAIAKF